MANNVTAYTKLTDAEAEFVDALVDEMYDRARLSGVKLAMDKRMDAFPEMLAQWIVDSREDAAPSK